MTHFLYENLTELQYGVVDLTELGLQVTNVSKISHVGNVNPVAVPDGGATLLLLGAALGGLGAARRFN
jgi:hypothetical protein